MNRNDLNKIRDVFFTLSKANNFKLLDALLSKTEPKHLSQEAMLVYLQATLDNKEKYLERNNFIELCRTALQERNEKVDKKFERFI